MTTAHVEHAAVSTSLLIRKWDEDAAAYVLRREDEGLLAAFRRGRNVDIHPDLFAKHKVEPYEVWQRENVNNVLQAGWVALLGGIAGTSITTKFSASAGRIGVGTSTTAVSYTQTALVGDTGGASTTSYYQLVSSAPTIATGSSPATLTFVAAFGTGNANFAWNEFGTDNGAASSVTTTGVFINRGQVAMGTKASGQTWTATETISFGFPSGSGTVS